MRTNQLMLYKNFEHGKLLEDMTFLLENCENEYYNKEDLIKLIYECLNELLEMTASHGFEGNLWHCYLTFLLANDENLKKFAERKEQERLNELKHLEDMKELKKTLEAIKGAPNVIFHLYNSTSPAQRKYTFNKTKDEIKQIAIDGIKCIKSCLTEEEKKKIRIEYSIWRDQYLLARG